MKAAQSGISPRPSIAAWGVSLLAGAIVLLTVLAMLGAGVFWRERVLRSSLDSELQLREYAAGDETLEALLMQPRLFAPVNFIVPESEREQRRLALQSSRTLLSVLSAVSVSRIEEARTRLNSLPEGRQEALLARVQSLLEKLDLSSKDLSSKKQQLLALETTLEDNSIQVHLISKDFADLFGLDPQMQEDEVDIPTPYTAGVLQGLPRIKGLRDNIVDLSFLKVELDGLNASVKVEGSDPALAFSQRVEALRNSFQSVLAAREEIDARLLELDTEVKDTTKALQIQRSSIEAQLRDEIRTLSATGSLDSLLNSRFFLKTP